MTNVKTAVSLDAALFERVETVAQQMQVSRSRLVALALQEFLRKRENERLLAELNAVYADDLDEEEQAFLRFGLDEARKIVEWEDRDQAG